MALMRARVVWNGFSGGPGVNTLHFGATPEVNADAPQTVLDALKTFYNSLGIYLPSGVSITFESQLEIIDPSEGEVIDVVTATPPSPISGTATGGYSSGSGMCLHWITGDYVRGRRVRGRTFMVPLASGAFDATGTLANGMITTVQTAAGTLLAREDVQLSIFKRPVRSDEDGQLPAGQIIFTGSQHRVTTARISDKGAFLTSRRE